MNNPFSSSEEEGTGVLFRDMITLALAAFLMIVVLLLPFVHPPGTKNSKSIKAPGNIMVEIIWPPKDDVDVDLWVLAPGDVPVGYSNPSGKYFNLLRDDLGTYSDYTKLNYENAYTRGIIPGEYVVNLHLYRGLPPKETYRPIKVRVIVSVKQKGMTRPKQIIVRTMELEYANQEITVVRFKLDKDGNVIEGSLNSVFKELRSPIIR